MVIMMSQIIQKIQEKASNQKLIEISVKEKESIIQFIVKFLNTEIFLMEYDSKKKKIKTLFIKGIQGLNEPLSYILLDFIDAFPEMNTDEFEKLSDFEKALHYAINTTGIILNQVSLTNSNLFMKISETDNNLLIMLPDSSMVAVSSIKKTDDNVKLNIPHTVYGIMTKSKDQNQIVTQILESIKVMVMKGEELAYYEKNISQQFIQIIELLLMRITHDSKSKLLKSVAVFVTKASIALTVIYLLIIHLIH